MGIKYTLHRVDQRKDKEEQVSTEETSGRFIDGP